MRKSARVYSARDGLSVIVEALDDQHRRVQIVLDAPEAMSLADELTRRAEPIMQQEMEYAAAFARVA
jgi:hypothetical protein